MPIPTHDLKDGRCPHCEELSERRRRRECVACQKPLPKYIGQGRVGFESPEPRHNHFNLADGKASTSGVGAELCGDCYLASYAVAYPGKPLPTLPAISLDP